MTTPDDSTPLAPRRPLGKQPGTTSTVAAPADGSAPPVEAAQPADSRAATTAASGDDAGQSRASTGSVNGQRPPAGQPARGSSSNGSANGASNGSSNGSSRPDGGPRTPAVVGAGTSGASAGSGGASPWTASSNPAAIPLYAGPSASTDVETQPAIPIPPGLAPVPPAPPAPEVDKKADRAAAKAARKAESSKPRTVRRAKLRIVRVDPWSITKTAFLLSIAFGIMCVVAVFLIFSIMSASGLWDSVNSTIQGVVDQRPSEAFDIKDYVGMSRVMGITMLVAAIDVIIITALATLGAFIYNMSASLLGGVEVTLAEDLH